MPRRAPRVIRPDLILDDEGWTIAETDSVPGGIGLTGWLNQTYAGLGFDVIGDADGMLDGFATVLPRGGDILVSQESATYRPEMEWLVRQLNARFPSAPGTLCPRKITSRKPGAMFTGSSNYLICRICLASAR